MSRQEEQEGRKCVENILENILHRYDLEAKEIFWDLKTIGTESQTLIYYVNKNKYTLQFARDDLEDCARDKNVYAKLENHIKHSIQSFHSKKIVGFSDTIM